MQRVYTLIFTAVTLMSSLACAGGHPTHSPSNSKKPKTHTRHAKKQPQEQTCDDEPIVTTTEAQHETSSPLPRDTVKDLLATDAAYAESEPQIARFMEAQGEYYSQYPKVLAVDMAKAITAAGRNCKMNGNASVDLHVTASEVTMTCRRPSGEEVFGWTVDPGRKVVLVFDGDEMNNQ